MWRLALLLAAAQRASSQCVLPSTLSDYGPVLNAFQGSGLSLVSAAGSAPPASMAGQGGSAMLAFTHPTRANAFAIECGVALDVNFVKAYATMVSAGPGVSANGTRCTLLSIANNEMGSSVATLFTSLANPAQCTAPATETTFNDAAARGYRTTVQLGSASPGYPTPCANLNLDPKDASHAAMAGVAFLGSAAGLTVNITNTTILMPEPAGTFAPLGNSAPYSILTCIMSARVLPGDGTVAVQSTDGKCAYLTPFYAAGFLSATTTWVPCLSTHNSLTDVTNANPGISLARFSGAFAAPRGAAALPPPPPPVATTLRTVPTVTFDTTLAFSDLASLTVSQVAAKVLTPCSVAALRSSYSAGLGVPLASILLARITLSDGSFMDLSPGSAGNAAAGACAANAARLLRGSSEEEESATALSEDTARALGVLLVRAGEGGARALQALTAGSIAVKTTVVSPPVALAASLTGASPDPLTLNVASLGTTSTTPSGGARGNATLALPKALPARINPYTPSALVKSWNAVPRGDSSNVFSSANLDVDSIIKCAQALGAKASCANNYIFGALAPGLALIVCGVVFLIVWLLAYCCACIRCCYCCKPRDRSATGKFATSALWLPRLRLLLGIINFGLIFGAVGYMPLFPKGITGLSATADSLVGTLEDLAKLLPPLNGAGQTTVSVRLFGGGTTQALTPPITAINAAATALKALSDQITPTSSYAQCPAAPPSSSTCSSSFVVNLLSGTSAALGAAGGADLSSAGTAIGGAVGTIKSSLGSLNLAGVAGSISGAALPLFAIIAVMCVLQAVWVCRCWFACCMFKALAPISIICESGSGSPHTPNTLTLALPCAGSCASVCAHPRPSRTHTHAHHESRVRRELCDFPARWHLLHLRRAGL